MTEYRINPAQQVHGQAEIDAGTAVLESGHWAEGEKAQEFREVLSQYLGVKHVILTNSGSSANLAAIMALTTHRMGGRIGEGTEVITPALCFPTTVSPIYYSRATPVFVDVDESWNIDPNEVERAITDKTRAIVSAHNLGNPFNLDAILAIASKYDLLVIEDNCDSLGSEWNGRKTGSIGHIGTSSFYPAHHISTGEGGAVYTNDDLIARAIKSIVNWGRDCWCAPAQDNTCKRRYDMQLGGLPEGYDHKNTFSEFGFNLKFTDIQSAIGIEQMKRLDGFISIRRHNYYVLLEYFSRFKEWFDFPKVFAPAHPSWFGYVVKLKERTPFTRNEMVLALQEVGIQSRAFFCGNVTKQPVLWGEGGYRVVGDLKRSDDIMNNAFWIGVHPAIGANELAYMLSSIDKFLKQY